MIEYAVLHPWRVAITIVAGVLLGAGAFLAFQVQTALNAVATEEFDPDLARDAIDDTGADLSNWVFVEPSDRSSEETYESQSELARLFDLAAELDPHQFNPHAFGKSIDDELFTSYLLVGTDSSSFLADVIILALEPADGSQPVIVSLPRDLYVWNVCESSFTRLNAGLGGCPGFASGTEMLAILVEDYTGISVDHSARTDFNGFIRVVNAMGGTTICVDYPTRDTKSKLDIGRAGCRQADGATTLAWVRSRHTEQLRSGSWVQVASSDFSRQSRQQDVLFQLAGKAARFSTPASLANKLSAVVSSVRLDSSWSFGQAVSVAWRNRGVSKETVLRFSIDATSYRTPGGAAVLLPSRPFADQLGGVFEIN
ncbi:MAG TPA: LCP family protein [Acidimicrobiia bacterium]|nr:LCP family protein [Acidimicrobiia bacterium]